MRPREEACRCSGRSALAVLLLVVGLAACGSTRATSPSSVWTRSGTTFFSAATPSTTLSKPAISVYGGYYDTHHDYESHAKPSPWSGSPNVVFVGAPDSTGGWDTSAVRIDNLSNRMLTIKVVARIGSHTFRLRDAGHIPASHTLILAPNFDGSDLNNPGCHTCEAERCATDASPIVPVIDVTIEGVTTRYFDRAQVLNARGVDRAGCPYPGKGVRRDESQAWTPIVGPG